MEKVLTSMLLKGLPTVKVRKLSSEEVQALTNSNDPEADSDVDNGENGIEYSDHWFQCSKCDDSFAQKTGLANHLDEVHKGFRFQCQNCGRKFILSPEIANHSMKCKKPLKIFSKNDPDPDDDVSEYEQLRLQNMADVQCKYNQLLKDLGKDRKPKRRYLKRQTKPKVTKTYKTRKIDKSVKGKTKLQIGLEGLKLEEKLYPKKKVREYRQNYRKRGFQDKFPFNQYADWT